MSEHEMPRYKSHKTVQALEIKTILRDSAYVPMEIRYADFGYEEVVFVVPEEMLARYQPKAGDFHVFYVDGYASFSPRKAFLEGYTKE